MTGILSVSFAVDWITSSVRPSLGSWVSKNGVVHAEMHLQKWNWRHDLRRQCIGYTQKLVDRAVIQASNGSRTARIQIPSIVNDEEDYTLVQTLRHHPFIYHYLVTYLLRRVKLHKCGLGHITPGKSLSKSLSEFSPMPSKEFPWSVHEVFQNWEMALEQRRRCLRLNFQLWQCWMIQM